LEAWEHFCMWKKGASTLWEVEDTGAWVIDGAPPSGSGRDEIQITGGGISFG
jgi:hypothetical protein